MLNWSRIENPLGAFVAVAWVFFLVWLSWQSPQSIIKSSRRQPSQTYPTNDASQKAEENPHRPWLTRDAAGFFTFWLVVVGAVQIGLFVWQLRLIRQSFGDAEQAANAAALAAEAAKENAEYAKTNLLVLERAYIIPAFVPVEREAETWHVHILLTNVGRSFGTVKGLFAQFAEPDALPITPPENGYEKRITDTTLYPDFKTGPVLIHSKCRASKKDRSFTVISGMRIFLVACGAIISRSIFGVRRNPTGTFTIPSAARLTTPKRWNRIR